MAFFGLTALGPQNSFAASAVYYRNIQIFDDEDFKQAWNIAVGKGTVSCSRSDIPLILRALFHGPTPENEVQHLENAFDDYFFVEDSLSFENYLKIMIKLGKDAEKDQKSLEGCLKPTCEYISSSEFKESLQKNAAIKRSLQSKYTVPITSQHEVSLFFLSIIFGHNKRSIRAINSMDGKNKI